MLLLKKKHNKILMEPQIAKKSIKSIREVIKDLCYMPERFPVFASKKGLVNGVHRVNVKNFAIFYRVLKDKMIVSVLHVIYGGRDIE